MVSIAQFGSTRSINAGVAAGVAMHAWIRQHADLAARLVTGARRSRPAPQARLVSPGSGVQLVLRDHQQRRHRWTRPRR